jgi:hypothetical protein
VQTVRSLLKKGKRTLRVVHARGMIEGIELEEPSHVHDRLDDAPGDRGPGLGPAADTPDDDR